MSSVIFNGKNSKFRAKIFPIFAAVKKLNDIVQPISTELTQFEAFFEHTLKAESEPMSSIMQYVRNTQGKRLRPILVLLSAKLLGKINEQTLRSATFVEMVHSATLIHDDVVDNADARRKKASVKAQFGNPSAVLSGDYLLAKAIMLISNDTDILNEMLQTAVAMSEGELIQNTSKKAPSPKFAEQPQRVKGQKIRSTDDYLNILTRKTALLMRSCCVAGALSVEATSEKVQQISNFGLSLGILFQLRDDILDGENTDEAQVLLPEYLQKTMESLKDFPESETLEALRDLTIFCAEREE